jgi:hypothetical protein
MKLLGDGTDDGLEGWTDKHYMAWLTVAGAGQTCIK